MILTLFCPICAFEAQKGLPHARIEVALPIARLSDDREYEVHCEAGHTSRVFVNNLKFELLFELGINALIDGYPREAVSSFASALERFYEFFCQVAALALSIPKWSFRMLGVQWQNNRSANSGCSSWRTCS